MTVPDIVGLLMVIYCAAIWEIYTDEKNRKVTKIMDLFTPGGSPIHWHRPSQPKTPRIPCPLCGKEVSQKGLSDHITAKHKRKTEGKKKC